jgi:hypothetical protein
MRVLSWTRQELVESALILIRKKIDLGRRYGELKNLREIEKRLGFSGVAEEVEGLVKEKSADRGS